MKVLPKGWRYVKLSEVGEIITGSTPSKAQPQYYGKDIPFVTPVELGDAAPVYKAVKYLSLEGAEHARMIPTGSVMVCCIGSLGKIGVTGRDVCTNQQINSIVPHTDTIDSQYLFHVCSTLKPLLVSMAPATTVPIVNKSRFSALEIPLPPLAEQKRIAAILDKADAIRKKRKQAIELTEQLLRATFLEMFGDPVTNPKGWEIEKLGNSLNFVTSGSRGWAKYYADSGARFIRSLDVQMNQISPKDIVYVNAPKGAEADRTRVKSGDVLLTITGSKIGRVAPVPPDVGEAHISQHVAILRLKDSMNPFFLSMFLSEHRGGQMQIARMQYGQTKPGLNLQQIQNLSIPVVPRRIQDDFEKRKNRLYSLSEKFFTESELTTELFDSLSQHAFRGVL